MIFELYLLNVRTENSIKNHWNCSVSKKLESHLGRDFMQQSCHTHTGTKRMDLESNMHTSLDLALGPPSAREAQLPTSDGGKESKFGIAVDRYPAAFHQTNTESRKSDNNAISRWPNKLCNRSHNLAKLQFLSERSHEPSKTVNSLHSTALSVPSTLSLSSPDVSDSKGGESFIVTLSSHFLIIDDAITLC